MTGAAEFRKVKLQVLKMMRMYPMRKMAHYIRMENVSEPSDLMILWPRISAT